ncbi:MAG: hypothetical protein ACYTDU_16205 [Planctomycetota bacterium]|jgi:hypothetical protein
MRGEQQDGRNGREGQKGRDDRDGREDRAAGALVLEDCSARALFQELVAVALEATGTDASPPVASYLVGLMDDRVRAAPPAGLLGSRELSLAETLLTAGQERGAARIRRLRDLGDRALFTSGFFGDSLSRSLVDLDYYRDIGRIAYSGVAASMGCRQGASSWSALYEELADRFLELVDVLAEVSDRTCGGQPTDLLRIYERYLRTGSLRERRRLILSGCVPPEPRGVRFWQ